MFNQGSSYKSRLRAILLGVGALAFLFVLALAFTPTRVPLLRLAEAVGLWKEAQHTLVPVQDEQGRVKYWTCTMHPSVRAAGPGMCPI